jgi:hypothetical protein
MEWFALRDVRICIASTPTGSESIGLAFLPDWRERVLPDHARQ